MNKHVELLTKRYPALSVCAADVEAAYAILEECFLNGNKLLIAGNGGSAADAEHIVGELMKGFKMPRACSEEFQRRLCEIDGERGAVLAKSLQGGLLSIALDGHMSLSTAFINDVENGGSLVYAQQVYGDGKQGDVLLAISTSGNAKNVMNATVVARALGMKVIGLTGAKGGLLSSVADVTVKVPETETYMVQELHLPVYHCLCLMLEEKFFG